MTIFKEFKREGEWGEYIEAHKEIWGGAKGKIPLFFLNFETPNWSTTGWLLERLPEWEDLEDFAEYHGFKVYGKGAGGTLWYYIPMNWLTSPSILPEKIGEYIKWRDEK